jgi:hypothetical protein
MAIVKKEKIHGVEVEFEVDSNGRFTADAGDVGEFSGATLREVEDEVTKALKRASSQKPIEVTFLNLEAKRGYGGSVEYLLGSEAIDVTLRSYAPRTRDWLITVDGKKGKVSKGYSDSGPVLAKRLTGDEHALWSKLQQARRQAEADLAKFIADRKLDTKPWTDKA